MKARDLLVAVLISLVAGALGIASAGHMFAQGTSRPTFEVASLKPNISGDSAGTFGVHPGGRLVAVNVTVRDLIRFAYQVQSFQILGGPSWVSSERFDITAKAEGDVPPGPGPGVAGPPGPIQQMMQSLLVQRFKLATHVESREMAVFNLLAVRSDDSFGEQLRKSDVDCAAAVAARRRGPPPPPPAPSDRLRCGVRLGPGLVSAGGMAMTQFANILSVLLQGTVIDGTGLAGSFDIDLTYTPEQPSSGVPAIADPAPPPVDPNRPVIFTALREQLGLRLEPGRGPVPVLVIDSVQPPTPD